MVSIFTQIIDRQIPGHFIWEDDLCFSILTIQPIRQGHAMVIPREEVDHWDDVPEATAAHMMNVSQKIAKAIKSIMQKPAQNGNRFLVRERHTLP
ncbi:MAG: HIT family protein [Gammaproteobacteria bacterium]